MDGDGDLDIVSQSNLDDTIAWYENDGAADPSWTAADIDTNINGGNGHWGGDSVAADMDGDSDLDLVSTQNGTTVWYENDGASDPSWTVATISTMGFASIHVTDMDNDGDLDIVAPYWGAIHYYENDGASDPSWTQGTNISSSSGSASVYVADMDGDSDLDVASAEFGTDTIAW
ncbi:MAG: VCBS repeat-containing protein, partial [Candidatus Thermoplasmatota archaeon]|nr:VCBS repeat-containing protein [Candidatus Thermoplasmatota archaeon]